MRSRTLPVPSVSPSAARPGTSLAARVFMNKSSMPTSDSLALATPPAAPRAIPNRGTKNSRPIRPPHDAARGAGPGDAHPLVKLDLAVGLMLDHDRVLEAD